MINWKKVNKSINKDFVDKLFNNDNYSNKQKGIFFDALHKGFTYEQMELLTNCRFNDQQTYNVMLGFVNGIDVEGVKKYAKPEINEKEMFQMFTFLLNNR